MSSESTMSANHTEEVRFLVDVSSIRFLLFFTPIGSVALFFGTMAGSSESIAFHIVGALVFAVPFSIFMLVRVIKAGYLVLDPKRSKIVISGQSVGFRHLSNPQVGSHEVEFMSTQWHPMRGTGEGLQISPSTTILFNTGHSRRKLQKIADILAEMLEDFERKEAARAARSTEGRRDLHRASSRAKN